MLRDIKIHHKRDNMPLGNLCHFTWSQNREKNKLGAQIDIINTLSMAMVKIFSQLLLYIPYYGMDDRYLSLSAS